MLVNLESKLWCPQFFQQNKQKFTLLSIFSLENNQDSDFFVRFLGKLRTPWFAFEIDWPLVAVREQNETQFKYILAQSSPLYEI